MGAPSTPPESLAEPGRRIREVRQALKLTIKDFAAILNYGRSHMNKIELGEAGYSGCIERCEEAVGTVDKTMAADFAGLAQHLRAADEESKAIDTHRGTERKLSLGRVSQLDGEWHAIWQTYRDGEEAAFVETVTVDAPASGRAFNMGNRKDSRWLDGHDSEPPSAGADDFLRWTATCRMLEDEHWINGEFDSLSTAKVNGLFRLQLDRYPEAMAGEWLGPSRHSEKTHGLLVLARSEASVVRRFALERERATSLPCAAV